MRQIPILLAVFVVTSVPLTGQTPPDSVSSGSVTQVRRHANPPLTVHCMNPTASGWCDPNMHLVYGLEAEQWIVGIAREEVAHFRGTRRAGLGRGVWMLTSQSQASQAPSAGKPADTQATNPAGNGHEPESLRFHWWPALGQSFFFLAIEHGYRVASEEKTRKEFRGKFFEEWLDAASNIDGWSGGKPFTKYLAHPLMGSVSGFIQVQNDPRGRIQEFGRSKAYWKSRMKALGWATLYSTQYELGPLSEASIGYVGKQDGQNTYKDLVITPLGGMVWILGEDILDRYVVRRIERNTT